LVNLSAWKDQDNFEDFLIDYLCSPVGYEVPQPKVARTFVEACPRQYSLVLDGLDEIPAELRKRFSECLDKYVSGLPNEVAVIVTCRIEEYEELRDDYPTGLGLIQAVEILPLTGQELDEAFAALATKRGKDWKKITLTQRQLASYRLVRDFLSTPLFLNLAVEGDFNPRELLDRGKEQELRDLVLERYLERKLAGQRQYTPADARRYLAWIARFLSGAEVSHFGLKTSDSTVFDLANLTPPGPPRRYRLFFMLFYCLVGLVLGLLYGYFYGLVGLVLAFVFGLFVGPFYGLISGLVVGLFHGLNSGGWFVLLQKVAHRRLHRANNLPLPPYDFLEWGIEMHIFRRVGGGVRFRHSLIQQRLADTSEATP